MRNIRAILCAVAAVLCGPFVQAQSVLPLGIRTNGVLVGAGTNLFSANEALFGNSAIKRVNGVASGLTVTNGLDVTGNAVVNGELSGTTVRLRTGPTNRIVYTGTNGVLNLVPNVDPALLQQLLNLRSNVQAQIDWLATVGSSLSVAATNGTAVTPTLVSPTVNGGMVVNGSMTVSGSLVGNAFVGLYDGFGEPTSYLAPIIYVDFKAPAICANLAALKALTVSFPERLAVVLNDTGSDGAAGDWYYDPTSTASESAVIVRPNTLTALDPGRWFKR